MAVKTKLSDILAKKGIPMDFQSGGTAPEEMIDREIKKEDELSPRIKAQRELYFNTLSSSSVEFPYWYTRRYLEVEGEIPVVRRAEALKCAFEHLTPVIYPGELLTMGKANYNRGSYAMPWLTESFFMSQEDEFYETANSANVSADEVAKFNSGGGNVTTSIGNVKSIGGKFGIRAEEAPALSRLANEWYVGQRYEKMVKEYPLKASIMRSLICMIDSGFTVPQGREVVNYSYFLQDGFDVLIQKCEDMKPEVAGDAGGDPIIGMDRVYFYEASKLVLEGVQTWILNYAKEAERLAEFTEDKIQSKEYSEMADCLNWIAHNQPRTFREALQLTLTVHYAILNEDVMSGLSPGRLGQVLYPWFEQDIESGRATEKDILELLDCYRIKLTCLDAFAAMGTVGGITSGNTFNNVSLGGLTQDGQSACNRLEYLIVESGMRNPTTQPTLSVLYDEKLPEDFLMKCVECNKVGTGYPAWMNNRGGIEFIQQQYQGEGMTIKEARAFAIGGCLETAPSSWFPLILNGKEYEIPGGSSAPTSIGIHFLSLPKVMECVLNNGKDERTGEQVYEAHNKKFETFQELFDTWKDYYSQSIHALIKCMNVQHDVWGKNNMAVFQSLTKPDCLSKGQHVANLGYRYNGTFNVETCGTITFVNSMTALKKLVFDDKKYTLEEMVNSMKNNFGFKTAEEIGNFSLMEQETKEGYEKYDEIYSDCLMAPKFGNDDPYADSVLQEYEVYINKACHSNKSLWDKELYPCQISVSSHGAEGAVTMATPDGRLAGVTFADGSMSATSGTDKNGPYALFNSASCWDQTQSQNSQMNMKIHPSAVKGEEGTKKLLDMTRSYMRKGGFHIQYNIVDSKVLKDAQENPGNYRDLMVRVAGFTQFWCEINKPIQDEVISRTEYEGV